MVVFGDHEKVREVLMNVQSVLCIVVVGLSVLLCWLSPVLSVEVVLEDVQLEPIKSDAAVLTIKSLKGVNEYTLAKIESIGLKRLRTSTFWPEDDGVYEGVLLSDLLVHGGMEKCTSIGITALDDYQVGIPCKDIEKWPVLLATRREGKMMSIREKGPTRIIYPKDLGGDIAFSDMRNRWIWAIKTISVED